MSAELSGRRIGDRGGPPDQVRRRVVILQRIVPHYRVVLFNRLRDRLADESIELDLIYGQELPGQVPRSVALVAPWAHRIRNVYLRVGREVFAWQLVGRMVSNADLVVFEAANSLVSNYVIATRCRRARQRIAFWGHGIAMSGRERRSIRERARAWSLRRADWWFAYTQGGADSLHVEGMPTTRTTILYNTFDAAGFRRELSAVSSDALAAVRERLGIDSEDVGIFCGGMYPAKRLDFLLHAASKIRERVPTFHLILVGDGPNAKQVEEWSRRHSWMHYVGAQYGASRAPYFRLSRVLLMPGLVGLAVIDSFAAGVPLFTTSHRDHSPEIEYVRDEVNGVITRPDTGEFASAVVTYLADRVRLNRVAAECERSATEYGIDGMVERFVSGIVSSLAMPMRARA